MEHESGLCSNRHTPVIDGAVAAGSYVGALGNPYDAIPPAGMNTIAHAAKNVHCMCTDDVAAAQIADGAIPLWEAVPAILAEAGL